jgi:hypothetical protein
MKQRDKEAECKGLLPAPLSCFHSFYQLFSLEALYPMLETQGWVRQSSCYKIGTDLLEKASCSWGDLFLVQALPRLKAVSTLRQNLSWESFLAVKCVFLSSTVTFLAFSKMV